MAEQAEDLARSEMPLLDHLVELRTRLLWCVAWFVLAFRYKFNFRNSNWKINEYQSSFKKFLQFII